MKLRIALWALAGVVVAAFWAISGPWPESNRAIWTAIVITCPIALLRSHPISLYTVVLANALTYALVGLGVEVIRRSAVAPASR